MLSNKQFREFVVSRVEIVQATLESDPEYRDLTHEETEILYKLEADVRAPFETIERLINTTRQREECLSVHCYMQGWRDALRSMLKE